MNVSDRQFGRRPAVPAEGRHRSWPDTGRAGRIAAAAALSLLFASGLGAEPAKTPVFSVGPESERPTEATQIAAGARAKALSADDTLKQTLTRGDVTIDRTVAELTGTGDAVCEKLLGGYGDFLTHSGRRDVWLKITGGSYRAVCGASDAENWDHDQVQNFTGNRYIEMTGGIADFIFGGNWKDGKHPKMGGNTLIQVGGTAAVGSVYGANMACHAATTEYGTADSPVSLTVRAASVLGALESCAAEGPLVQGYLVGGGVFRNNGGSSRITVHGSTAVEVVVPEASGTFEKTLIGGHLATGGGFYFTDKASVTVDAPKVTFSQPIVGGGKDRGDSNTAAETAVTLKNGIFAGTVTAGGDNAKVAGTATLDIQGGTYEATAKLLPGNAAKSVLKLSDRLLDLSSVAEVGAFGRVEVAPGYRPTVADRHVHTGTVYSIPQGSSLCVKLTGNLDRTYVFPGRVEGDGLIRVGLGGDSPWQPLVRNRVRLGGQDLLWAVPADGSWNTGWLTGIGESAEAPTNGSFFIDASGLTQDTEVTVPAGTFGTVSVFGNGTSFLTLRFESGVTAETLNLYQDARVRFAAADGETIPFAVTGSGIFEAACAGRTELTRPITLTAPGSLRISGGTLAFANGNSISGDVRVCAGAVLDCNGVPDAGLAAVTLEAGATYANDSSVKIPVGNKQITKLFLEGDAFVRANAVFGMVAPGHARSDINMQGHTLTKTGAADFICANTGIGNGTLDIREGNVRAMPNGGVSTFWDLTVRTAAGCGIAVPETGYWAEFTGAVTLAPDDGTQMDVPVRINGGGKLRIASGTVKLLNTENLHWGAVQVDRGAVLDLTEPEVEVIHTDKAGDGYGWVGGRENHVIVRGTLRTRPWRYNGSLGGLAHESNRVLLDGGTVEFAGNESFEEEGGTRGYTVSSKGATLVVPAGGLYAKAENANARLVSNGTLKLRSSDPAGEPATVVYRQAVGGTVDVGDNVFLCGTGSVNTLVYGNMAYFDFTVDRAPMTVTGSVILPAAVTVKANTVPNNLQNGIVLLKLAANAKVVGGLNRRVTVNESEVYTLARREGAEGVAEIVAVPAKTPVMSLIDASMTSGKSSWSAVSEGLSASDTTPAEQAAAVINLAAQTDGTFTFDNATALDLSTLTLKGPGTVVLNGTVNVGRLLTDGEVTLKKGTGMLTAAATDVAAAGVLSVENGAAGFGGLTLGADAVLYVGGVDIAFEKVSVGDGAEIGFGLPGASEPIDATGLWNAVKDYDGTVLFSGPAHLGTPEKPAEMRLTKWQTLDIRADLTVNKLVTSDSGSANTWIVQTDGTLTVTSSDSGIDRDHCAALIAHWARPTAYSLTRGTLSVPNGSVVLGWDGTLDMTVGKDTADDASDAACFSAKYISGAARGNTAAVTVKKTGILELGEGGLNLTNGTAKTVTFAGGMLRTTANLSGDKLKINAGFRIDGSAVFCAKTGTVQQPNKLVGDANAVLTVGAPGWDGTVALADTDLSGYAGTVKLAAGALLLNAGSENGIAVPEGSVLKLRLSEEALKQTYTAQVPEADRARVVFVDALGTEVPSANGVYAPVTTKTVTLAVPAEGAAWSTLTQGADLRYGDTLELQIPAGATPTVTVGSPVEVEKLTVTGSGTLLFAGSLKVVNTLEIARGTTLGLTKAMLAETVTLTNAGTLRWLEPEVSLTAAGYSSGKGTVAFLGTADNAGQTLKLSPETPMDGADLHLGNVTVTGGALDLPQATMTVEGDVVADTACLRVGQGPHVTTTVTQTAGCVSGRGTVHNEPSYIQFNGWSATSTYNLQGGELNLPVTFYMTGGTAALNISGGRLTSKVTTVNNPASVTVTLSETGVLATALPAQVNLKAQGGTVVGAADRTVAATAVLTGGAQGVLLDASAAPVVFTAATVADPAAALRVKVGTDTNARDLVRGVGTGLNDFTLEGHLPAGLKADWDADTQTLRLVKAAAIPPEYTSEAGDAVLKLTGGTWPTTVTGTTGNRVLTTQAISDALTVFDGIASGDTNAVTVYYEFGIRAMNFDAGANQLKLTVALTNGTGPAQLTKGTVLRLYEGSEIKATYAGALDERGEAVMTLEMHPGAFLPIKVEAYKETSAPAAR